MSKIMSDEANWHNVLAGELEKCSITPQTLNIPLLNDQQNKHCDSKTSKMSLSEDKVVHQEPRQMRKVKSNFACEAEVRRKNFCENISMESHDFVKSFARFLKHFPSLRQPKSRDISAEYKEKTISALNQKMIAGELDKLRQHLTKLKRINASTNKVPLAPRPLRIRPRRMCHHSRDSIPSLDTSDTTEEQTFPQKMFRDTDDIDLDLRSKRQSFVIMPPLFQLKPCSSSNGSLYNETSLPSVSGNSFSENSFQQKGPTTTPTSLYHDVLSDPESDLEKAEETNHNGTLSKSEPGDGDWFYWKPNISSTKTKKEDIGKESLELSQPVNISRRDCDQSDNINPNQGRSIAFKEQDVPSELDHTKDHVVDYTSLETNSQTEYSLSMEEAEKKSELERKRHVQKRAYSRWMSYVCNKTALNARAHQKPQPNNSNPSHTDNDEKVFPREEKIAMVLGYIDRMKKSQPTTALTSSKSVTPPKMGNDSVSPTVSVDVRTVRANNGPFENRFQAQRDLIKKQKMKLDEQEKKIQELTLVRLQEEAKSSKKEFLDTLDHLAGECTVPIRSQMKSLKVTANQQDFSTPGKLVERMEQRAKEREVKKQLAAERRRMQEEERKKKMQEDEEKRVKEEDEKKRHAMAKIREENIRRREMRETARKEQEKMFQLKREAERLNERRLCLLGLRAFKNLVLRRQVMEWQAEDYCRKRMMRKALLTWKRWVAEEVAERVAQAVSFYNENLLRKTFDKLKQAVEDSIRLNQVAEDMYEMRLQEKIFRKWCQYTTEQHLRTADKLAEADDHYNRCILKKYFRLWRKYPEVAHLEREKEKRKMILRKKVQTMLPDFQPVAPDYYRDINIKKKKKEKQKQ